MSTKTVSYKHGHITQHFLLTAAPQMKVSQYGDILMWMEEELPPKMPGLSESVDIETSPVNGSTISN